MSVFIVGADVLGNIPSNLSKAGVKTLQHFKGRKRISEDIQIPANTDLVLVITDYISHNIAELIKRKAKEASLPVVFSKRSWSHLQEKIQPYMVK
ncbi:DUF2325 domain-containing protein [Sporomusa sp.]|jgi:hypothetical protein|uniref:DUF2325 domain-containing protein n=1 Tax=Sporomusa sp. TaxID=2078658 RepID=UPI002C62849C|nr:DUF2325 domain-containing protein [Sporomusa sp.]MDF2874082.1 hypothetical protein [Sporomusa sp.]HWR07937.1 DUF2325 domain-containing protein [Sporomusa sp.]